MNCVLALLGLMIAYADQAVLAASVVKKESPIVPPRFTLFSPTPTMPKGGSSPAFLSLDMADSEVADALLSPQVGGVSLMMGGDVPEKLPTFSLDSEAAEKNEGKTSDGSKKSPTKLNKLSKRKSFTVLGILRHGNFLQGHALKATRLQ